MPPKKKVPRTGGVTYKFEPEKMQAYVDAAREMNPIAGALLDTTLLIASQHGSIQNAVAAAYESDESLQEHGQALKKHFPGPSVHQFLSSDPWPTGLHCLELWMLGVRPSDGYSLPTDTDIVCVMALMLANGVNTNPAIPGVDALSTRKIEKIRSVTLKQ